MMSQTSYLSEIQAMMYAMGDCRRPLVETAVLLEQIVLRQLRSVYINGAMSENLLSAKSSPSTSHSNSSGTGGGNSSLSLTSGLSSCTITPQHCKSPFTAENLLTAVIRRDRNVAQRLIAYLKFNDLKFSFGRTNGETGEFLASIEADEEDVDVDLNEEESIASDETSIMEFASSTRYNRQPKGRRIRFCERVLRQLNVEFNSINNNNSSSANDDEIVAQRAKRRKTSTPNLSGGGAVNDDSNRSSSSSLIDELLYKAEENLSRDQAKIERQMRAARYAAEMDTGEYMHFSEARQLTFLPSACQKISKQASRRFLKWILGVWDENNLDEEATFDQDFLENQLRLQSWVDLLSADDIIVDMLNFLARETLSLLVDCAFFVKRECRPPNTPINYSSADIYRVRPIAPPPPAPRCSDDDCGGNLGVKNAAEFRQPTISLETNRSQTFGGYTTSNSASSSTNGRKRPLDEEKSYCPPQVPISSSEVTANLVDALTQRALTTCNSRMTVNNSQTSTNNQIQPSTINLTTDKTALQCWEVREAFRRLEYYEKFRKV